MESEGRESTHGTVPRAPGDASSAAEHCTTRLTVALAALGMRGTVEARERLAVIHLPSAAAGQMVDDALRHRLVALGRSAGFSHVALAIGDG